MPVQYEAVSVYIPVHPGGYEILLDGIAAASFRFNGLNLQKRKR
jgi:cytochrome b involved in lipid metabolism